MDVPNRNIKGCLSGPARLSRVGQRP